MEYYNNENMRRGDRSLTAEAAQRVLLDGEYGVLSIVEPIDEQVGGYGVPLNYVWDEGEFIYLHSALKGHKLTCVDICPNVSFCVVGKSKLVANEFTTSFESVIVRGRAERVTDSTQRQGALELLLKKFSPEHLDEGMKCIEEYFNSTAILRLRISSISGKGK